MFDLKNIPGLSNVGGNVSAILAVIAALAGLLIGLFIPSPIDIVKDRSGSSLPWAKPIDVFSQAPAEGTAPLTDDQVADLIGTKWATPIDGAVASISFATDSDPTRVVVQTGCNAISGEYAIENSTLTVSDMTATEMACRPADMKNEEILGSFLESPLAMTINPAGDTLWLSNGDKALELRKSAE